MGGNGGGSGTPRAFDFNPGKTFGPLGSLSAGISTITITITITIIRVVVIEMTMIPVNQSACQLVSLSTCQPVDLSLCRWGDAKQRSGLIGEMSSNAMLPADKSVQNAGEAGVLRRKLVASKMRYPGVLA